MAALVLGLTTVVVGAVAAPAVADTSPPSGTPATVSADPLPTVQINGVVWDQAIVGNTVYAGGSFSNARPAGAPSGSNTVSRTNVLAYNLQTGVMTSWAPQANAQVMDVAVSPDKSRIYVGGSFTSIAGSSRYRIAAFNAATGALITSFNAQLDGRVESITATDSTVYVGGAFNSANGQPRYRVAAFNASNGSLLAWRPVLTDGVVYALQLAPDGSKVVLGGSFTTVNGSSNPGFGLAAVHPTTGANLPFAANTLIRNAGDNAAVWSMSTDSQNLYVVAYSFHGGGTLEGTAAVRWSTGALYWVSDCHGDSYDVYSTGTVAYTASHNHYCGNNGSFGQTDPWTFYRATARTTVATGIIGKEPLGYRNWEGHPGPTVLNWFPDINAGTYTGQSQGPWSVSGDAAAGYVVYGGEFTRVNATNQQGLVRFATSATAPNDSGPRSNGSAFPVTARAIGSGTVRVSWQANADYDNEILTYRVLRDGATATTFTYASQVWRRPFMGYTDTVAAGSSHTYSVRVTDPFGNQVNSPTVSVTANGSGSLSPYAREVLADGASYYWRLSESSGTTIRDWAAANDGTAGSGLTYGAAGAIAGDSNTAVDLGSSLSSRIITGERTLASNYFTIETWVRASSGQRGRLIGYGNATSLSQNSSTDDRLLYIDNNGRIIFGVYPSAFRTITSPGSIANGQWRHVVASMGADGMKLYVDGALVASRADMITGLNYYGAWIIGSDSLSGWPARPSTDYFTGLLDEVAIYPLPLSASDIQQHHALGTGAGGGTNQPPDASFTASTSGLGVSVNASASADPDGTIASYAWNYGDGGTGTGVTASHTYASGGTYTVTLTVTDDDGATDQATRQVTVSDGAGGQTYAVDAFGRTVSNGWGSADVGGAWSLGGPTTSFSVGSGQGRQVMTSAGAGRSAILTGVSQRDVDAQVTAGLDKPATGSGVDLIVTGRYISSGNEYRAQAKVRPTGVVQLAIRRFLGGSATSLTAVDVPGLTFTTGSRLHIRMQVTGTSPTTLRARAWLDGQAEPSVWHVQTTDSSSALQGPGAVGLVTYLSGSATNAPLTATFDDLLVTSPDGGGAPPANQPPNAAFTSSTSALQVNVNGSSSNDPDGSIASYAWTFGDGGTGTGASTSHTYASAGTYTVTLTVTDDDGATDQATAQVTVSAGGGVPAFAAQDAFGRTVSNGWGSADVGGSWSVIGTASSFSVSGGQGRQVMTAAGVGRSAVLTGVSEVSVDAQVSASLDKPTTGSGADLILTGRYISSGNEYRAQAKVRPTGAVQLAIRRFLGGSATSLTAVEVPGLTYSVGQQLRIRMQVEGTSPTTLRAKTWLVGQAEPASWQVQTTDSSAALQAAGGVGLVCYLSGGATNAPLTASFDDLAVTPLG